MDFRKPHFNGRSALLKEQQAGPRHSLTRLDIEGNKVADGAWLYSSKRCTRRIGYITSAIWSPAAKCNIALAMVETTYLRGALWAEIYYEKEQRHYGKVARCTLTDKPFWAPERARQTPPPDY